MGICPSRHHPLPVVMVNALGAQGQQQAPPPPPGQPRPREAQPPPPPARPPQEHPGVNPAPADNLQAPAPLAQAPAPPARGQQIPRAPRERHAIQALRQITSEPLYVTRTGTTIHFQDCANSNNAGAIQMTFCRNCTPRNIQRIAGETTPALDLAQGH